MPKLKTTSREFKHGLINAKVSVRQTKGEFRYTLTIVRLYRNGDQWKESTRFGRDDIPVMRLVLDEAYGWILTQQQASVFSRERKVGNK